MAVLIINLLMYIIYTLWNFRKAKCLTVHNAVACWFCFIAAMGVISVEAGFYQKTYGTVGELPLAPYILAFVSFLFLMLPLRKLNYRKVEIVDFPYWNDRTFFRFLCVPLIVLLAYTIIYIPSVMTAMSYNDIADVYNAQRKDGVDIYGYSSIQLMIISIGRKFWNWFFGILVFYGLYYLNENQSKGIKKVCLILMVLSATMPYFLRTIATGGRGGFVFFSAKIVFVLLPLWFYFKSKFKKKLLIVGTGVLSFGFLYAVAMTVARILGGRSNETPFSSVIRYFGEPFPNLGLNLWGRVNNFLMGRRMFPELFGYAVDKSNSQYENFHMWERICGVPVLNYKTIYGDFYLEFGPVIALFVIAIGGILMYKYLSRGRLSFIELPLYSFYVDICVTAPLWFSRRNIGDLLIIVQCFVVSWFLSKLLKRRYSLP